MCLDEFGEGAHGSQQLGEGNSGGGVGVVDDEDVQHAPVLDGACLLEGFGEFGQEGAAFVESVSEAEVLSFGRYFSADLGEEGLGGSLEAHLFEEVGSHHIIDLGGGYLRRVLVLHFLGK